MGVVVCGALALTGTAHAKMPCPMGDMDASGSGAVTAGGPSGSDRSGSTGPLAPAGAPAPAAPAPGPSAGGRPAANQPAQPAASNVPAEVPATTAVPATTGASVPASATVPAATIAPVAVPVAAPVVDVQAQAAARRAAERRAAARRAAARRAAARRAARADTAALRARVAGKERYFAPGDGSAWVEAPAAAKVTASADGAPAGLVAGLGLVALLGLTGLAGVALRRRRDDDGAPAPAAVAPLDPSAAAHAARIEAELQEIIAEERAARELDGLTPGGRR